MAQIKPSYDIKRKKLSEIIPLNSPLSMYIEPTRMCNFKCFYCMHSTRGLKDGELNKTGFKLNHMSIELFDKLVKEIMTFPNPPKRICFSGLGEPLMNKNLPFMIKKLRIAGFKGRIDVITNASLLTPEVSDALIEAGISRLQISIQGLTREKYQEVCGIAVNIEELIKQIRYFYEHRKNTSVFIKIIDAILEKEEERQKFLDMFEDICDTIYIEHLVIMQQQMGNHGGRTDTSRNLNGEYVERREVCGVMFYFLQVNIDGETFPCSTPGLPNSFSMGCTKEKTLQEVWCGEKRNELIRKNLIDGYVQIPTCSKCSSCIAIADDTEYLDDCRQEILERFPKTEKGFIL